MPAVSIILPTCDRAYCLERAVRSVAMQSYENWELIIVDDGSTDATPDLCRSFANRLGSRLHYCQVHRGGVSRARNFGLDRAQAPFVAFLDSDDFWHVDKLGLQLTALEKERDALFSFTGFSTFGDGGTYACECVYVPPELSGRIYPDLYRIRYNVIVTPSIVCSRELAISVGGFDEQMAVCEDIDLWGRITARTRCVAIDRPLVGVHIRPEEKYPFQQALKGRVALY